MRAFYFECPTLRGQAMVLGEAPDHIGPDEYVEQDCPMCARAFWVNPATRHVRPDAPATCGACEAAMTEKTSS
jgi:hypothetical protein